MNNSRQFQRGQNVYWVLGVNPDGTASVIEATIDKVTKKGYRIALETALGRIHRKVTEGDLLPIESEAADVHP